MMVGGGRGSQRNQPKIIFGNHSLPLDNIGQAYTYKLKHVFRTSQSAISKFLQKFKNN